MNILNLLGNKKIPRDKIALKISRLGSQAFQKFNNSINESESWNVKMNSHSFTRYLIENTLDLKLNEEALKVIERYVPTYEEWIKAVQAIDYTISLRSRL
jgi:hypothetical protein